MYVDDYNINLWDIETSLSFAKLSTLHPNIIRTNDIIQELESLLHKVKNRLPLDVIYFTFSWPPTEESLRNPTSQHLDYINLPPNLQKTWKEWSMDWNVPIRNNILTMSPTARDNLTSNLFERPVNCQISTKK